MNQQSSYISYAGYIGALFLSIGAFWFTGYHVSGQVSFTDYPMLYAIIGITFVTMTAWELICRYRFLAKKGIPFFSPASDTNIKILKSTLYRFIVLFIPFVIAWLLVENHYYFTQNSFFKPTRVFFDYLLWIFLLAGIPYIFMTRKYLYHTRYEFNDYGILSMIAARALFRKFIKKEDTRLYQNRRITKILRLYLVNFFFLTLMARFFVSEFQGFNQAYHTISGNSFGSLSWYMQYKTFFLLFFHLLFIIDVGIATIGYSFASRWLDNRTRSVDWTWSGWIVALLCYPPLNTAFTSQFISYQGLPTHQLITNEYALAVVLAVVLLLYVLYVWATVALGFKFSNLTHRGIVTSGPYRFVRHPAYAAKNMAWWVDNTFVLTNIWATVGMILWNVIYILRALTEERHLSHYKDYQRYREKVKYKFIPKII